MPKTDDATAAATLRVLVAVLVLVLFEGASSSALDQNNYSPSCKTPRVYCGWYDNPASIATGTDVMALRLGLVHTHETHNNPQPT